VPGIRFVYVVIELSRLCITRAMTVRSDQCFMSYRFVISRRCFHISRSQVRQRGPAPSPSVSTDWSSDIRLLPGPYRTGSMWVLSSGWKLEVIAMPWL
jgi:hypothetical protein